MNKHLKLRRRIADMPVTLPALALPVVEAPVNVVHYYAKHFGIDVITVRRGDRVLVWRVPE